VEDLQLVPPDSKDLQDLANTKLIYQAFQKLTPAQASDKRLWTYLIPFGIKRSSKGGGLG